MIKAGLIHGCKPNSNEGTLVYNEPSVQVLGDERYYSIINR